MALSSVVSLVPYVAPNKTSESNFDVNPYLVGGIALALLLLLLLALITFGGGREHS